MIPESRLADWFSQLAQKARLSPDPSTQNAAGFIVTPYDTGLVYLAENRPIVPYDEERYTNDRDYRMAITAHAEERSINLQRKDGARRKQMIALWAPCTGCARDMVHAGVTRLFTLDESMFPEPFQDRWKADIALAREVLFAAGIQVVDVKFSSPISVNWRWNGREMAI